MSTNVPYWIESKDYSTLVIPSDNQDKENVTILNFPENLPQVIIPDELRGGDVVHIRSLPIDELSYH